MAKLTRKFVRATLEGEGTTDEKLEAIMTAFGASTANMIDKEEAETLKTNAINEALKDAPKGFKDSDEYKTMSEKLQEYEKKDAIRNLTDKGVKNEKYAEMLLAKLDSEKDLDEQLNAMKADYADMFNTEEERKPQFGSETHGGMPTGKDQPTFGSVWGFVPQKKE